MEKKKENVVRISRHSSVSGQTHGLPYKMRSLAPLRILMAVIDVFNKFSPFCWVLMDGLIPGGAGGATRS